MTRIRVFVLLASVPFASAAMLIACGGDDGGRASFVEQPDATDGAASLPPHQEDAGSNDADAAAPKPTYDASDEAVVCTTTPCVTQLAAGDSHFCALLSGGSVQCWGLDTRGSLGRGDPDGGDDAGSSPKAVVGITNATQVSIGAAGFTTCARTADGRAQCWGQNSNAQLGLDPSSGVRDSAAHPTPTAVAIPAEVARVDVGQANVCAFANSGDVYCWGANDSKQLARPDSDFYGAPGLADLQGHAISRVTLSEYSTFGLATDGHVLNWGRVSGRNSSLSDDEGSPVPVPLPLLSDVTRVETGGFVSGSEAHQCAIAGGNVYCWGGNQLGVLGTGVPDAERLPALAGILTVAPAFPQQLALASNRTCVRMTDGTIQCCGDNLLGQLGRGTAGTFASRFGPATAFTEHAVQIAASADTTCALVQDGEVMCWGGNASGELGQGTKDSLPHPAPVKVVFE
jgi:alpha-tubulin suppressor-like RCC1 family protein